MEFELEKNFSVCSSVLRHDGDDRDDLSSHDRRAAAAPCAMMYQPFLIPEQAAARESQQQSSDNKCPDRKRPASQATSVKAEPGSIMAMSESSKKVKRLPVDIHFDALHHVCTNYPS